MNRRLAEAAGQGAGGYAREPGLHEPRSLGWVQQGAWADIQERRVVIALASASLWVGGDVRPSRGF